MKIVCYDISSLIRKKLVLKTCPSCHADLATRDMEPSQASRAFQEQVSKPAISTSLGQCPDCGWWAVRELRSDDALYYPPVEAFILVDARKQGGGKRKKESAPWERVLADEVYWQCPVTIQSTQAIELFGSAQMLLPDISSVSGSNVFDRMKSAAPIVLPILLIMLIAFFSQ